MAPSRPLVAEEDLPTGAAPAPNNDPAVGVNDDGLPEDAPICISSGQEEEGKYEVSIANQEDGHQLMESRKEEDEDPEDEVEEDEESDDGEDWSDGDSEDSGYDSVYDAEEDTEDDDDDYIRPRSPLVQWFRPLVPALPPVAAPAAVPQQLTVWRPQELSGQRVTPPEECAPSTSGLSFSTKRRREESETGQVSAKRKRWDSKDSHRESAPAVSGFSRCTKRSREESDSGQVSAKRQRWDCEASQLELSFSTLSLGSSTNRSLENYQDSAPSTSGLESSAASSSEEDYWDSAPSTSGLGSSATSSREEDYWDSDPSTSSGLRSSTNRQGFLEFPRWLYDSDSD